MARYNGYDILLQEAPFILARIQNSMEKYLAAFERIYKNDHQVKQQIENNHKTNIRTYFYREIVSSGGVKKADRPAVGQKYHTEINERFNEPIERRINYRLDNSEHFPGQALQQFNLQSVDGQEILDRNIRRQIRHLMRKRRQGLDFYVEGDVTIVGIILLSYKFVSESFQGETQKHLFLHRKPIIEKMCSICLVDFDDDDVVNKIRCRHIYHKKCIEKWLTNNFTCPICRFKINTMTKFSYDCYAVGSEYTTKTIYLEVEVFPISDS